MRGRSTALLCVLGLGLALTAWAEPPPAVDTVQMDTVVVSGEQPGPGLWKVSRDGHVLWVLGTLSPLPKKFIWKSDEVEAAVASAQEVLTAPQVGITANVGLFARLALLPALIGVRNNPERAKLKDVVPADLYARWLVLKKTYMGHNGKVEKWRPIFAALDLYESAVDRVGLSDAEVAQKVVLRVAKRAAIKTTKVEVLIPIDDPKAAIKEFKRSSLDDLECFRKTLDRIDGDLGSMTARANAWATADLDALRQLPFSNQMTACKDAVTESSLIRAHGLSDLDARVEKAWLDAATAALHNNAVSFAMLPIQRLLAADGYLAELRAQGFTVQSPDEQDDAEATVSAVTQQPAADVEGEPSRPAPPSGQGSGD